MAEFSELTNDRTCVFTFLNKSDGQVLDFDGGRTSDPDTAANQLIEALGQDFLDSGIVAHGDVCSKIEVGDDSCTFCFGVYLSIFTCLSDYSRRIRGRSWL